MTLQEVLMAIYQVVGIASSLGALYFAYKAKKSVKTVHLQVNNRLDALTASEKEHAKQRGTEAERARLILEKLENVTESTMFPPCKLFQDIRTLHLELLRKAREEGAAEAVVNALRDGVDVEVK